MEVYVFVSNPINAFIRKSNDPVYGNGSSKYLSQFKSYLRGENNKQI